MAENGLFGPPFWPQNPPSPCDCLCGSVLLHPFLGNEAHHFFSGGTNWGVLDGSQKVYVVKVDVCVCVFVSNGTHENGEDNSDSHKHQKFRKGVGGQRGLAPRNPSYVRDWGHFAAPVFLCPLRRRGIYFWRTFWPPLGDLFCPSACYRARNLKSVLDAGSKGLPRVFCTTKTLFCTGATLLCTSARGLWRPWPKRPFAPSPNHFGQSWVLGPL